MPSDTYGRFIARVREANIAQSVVVLLDWDQETHMPPRGIETRASQMSLVAGVTHEKLVSDEFGRLLAAVELEADPDPIVSANVREMRRIRDRAANLPTELVQAIARTTALAREAWVRARSESNFALFAPYLAEILELKQAVAERIGYAAEPYDALLDEFEPGMRAADIQALFDGLRPELVALVNATRTAPRQPDLGILQRECKEAAQAEFGRRIASALGYNFEAGRMDVAVHPFCSGFGPHDVRITTRYDERYLPTSLFGTMHEVGHALYEQGLPPAHSFTPAGMYVSLGVHESQSRLWENMVGRSRPFWSHLFHELQTAFPALRGVTLDAWHFAINAVRPSLIRVEADEVTYNLHILLRFELERRLLTGQLAVRDVPAAWNDSMHTLLGVTPANDAQGCLQDVHWSLGILGYFPTYALGNLYAAQIFAAARRALGDLDGQLARGQVRPLLEWLRTNVHAHGQRYRAPALLERITGQPPGPEAFVQYLREKYVPLYGLH